MISITLPKLCRTAFASILCLLFPGAALPEEVFVDIANESGIDFFHFNGRSGEIYFPEIVGTGSALLDYDRDGDLDDYIVQASL